MAYPVSYTHLDVYKRQLASICASDLHIKHGSVPRAVSYTHLFQMAAIVLVALPIVAIYPFVQKYFVKGMLVGSVKG